MHEGVQRYRSSPLYPHECHSNEHRRLASQAPWISKHTLAVTLEARLVARLSMTVIEEPFPHEVRWVDAAAATCHAPESYLKPHVAALQATGQEWHGKLKRKDRPNSLVTAKG
eukprot:scaffold115719_cov19-Tisochrysis_lutea.AAC.1